MMKRSVAFSANPIYTPNPDQKNTLFKNGTHVRVQHSSPHPDT
jgi:hypothetical protein